MALGLAVGSMNAPPVSAPEDERAGAEASDSGVYSDTEASRAGGTSREAGAKTLSSQAVGSAALSDRAYVKLGRQVVIPIVEERRTEALMLFEFALEVPAGMTERAYVAEPRLRDAFLQTLLEMSYTGAFSTTYTDERVTRELRDKLRADAHHLLQGTVFDVLILNMLRQEL